MKGGLLLASLLLAFSGNVLSAAEAFNLSSAVFLFAVRAAQVDATVNILLAKMVAILAEINVVGCGVTDSSTVETMDGARFMLLSEVPASTALSNINFVEGDVSNNEVSEEEDSIVQNGVGILAIRVLELDERSGNFLVLHVWGDPLGSLHVDEVLEKVVLAEFTAKLLVSDQYVGVFGIAAWDVHEHDFGCFHCTLHNSVWESESLTYVSCLSEPLYSSAPNVL